jgi:hypothetical protein
MGEAQDIYGRGMTCTQRFGGESGGRRPLEKLRLRREDNIKMGPQ